MKPQHRPLLALLAVPPAPTFALGKALATVGVVDQRSAQLERKQSEIHKIVINASGRLRGALPSEPRTVSITTCFNF